MAMPVTLVHCVMVVQNMSSGSSKSSSLNVQRLVFDGSVDSKASKTMCCCPCMVEDGCEGSEGEDDSWEVCDWDAVAEDVSV